MKTRYSIFDIWASFVFHILLVILLAACAAPTPTPESVSFSQFILVTQDPNASPTPTPFQPSDATPTATPTLTVVPTSTLTPTPTLSPAPTQPTAGSATQPPPPPATSSRANYILYSTLDFAGKTITTDQTIRYYNNSGITLSDVVFSVQPNLYRNTFVLNSISQDNVPITSYNLDGQKMTVTLSQPLQAGGATTFNLSFDINIPSKSSSGIFGYDFNQINLVDWYPFIVPYINGWVLHEPMQWGEHLVYDSTDVELNLKTDTGVVIAAGTTPDQNGEWTRYRMYGVRTFALSASNEFQFSESFAGNTPVRSYYFNGFQYGADGMLDFAVDAVNIFSSQFAPYPHEALAIVQADINDGQEYDGLIFLSSDFYSEYGGTARSNLATIGVHEVAHQWWFSLVGSDQALEPWLDEALSLYSERIFLENKYPANISWWWQWRVDFFKPSGYVDTDIYNGGSFRSYTNAVYLNGAHFMDDLRERMGYGNFSKFIKEYASRYSYGHATSADFFALMRETINVDISDLLDEYFYGSY